MSAAIYVSIPALSLETTLGHQNFRTNDILILAIGMQVPSSPPASFLKGYGLQ
jgi:hypothetical protein